jgi:hypothetical protein
VLRGFNAWPRGNMNSDELLTWVIGGLAIDRNSLGNFATDGRHVLFSTLRPAAGREGALRIVAIRRGLLQGILLVLAVCIGLALTPAPVTSKALAVGAGVIALVLLAVFTPSLARTVVNNGTVGAGVIVLVVWGLWHLLVTLPRSPGWQAFREHRRARREERRELRAARRAARRGVPAPRDKGGGKAEPPGGEAGGGRNDAK